MSAALRSLFKSPATLMWWQWGKIAGLLAPFSAMAGRAVFLVAVHILCDFSLQSDWMAAGKAKREFAPLFVHSLIAGGVPGLCAGGAAGFVFGFVSHFLVDYTGKFGLSDPLGPVVDQALHVLFVGVAAAL